MKTLFNHRTVLIIVFALLCNTCAKEEIDVFGSISGTVRDEQQQPLEGVSVSLTPGGVTKSTGKDGSYSFIELEAKQYTLAYSKNEYITDSKEATVQAGVNTTLDVTLKKEQIIPILAVSAQSLDFGTDKTTLSLDVSNTGKGVLDWTIKHAPGWFICSPMTGTTSTERSSITVTVNRSQKEKGSHSESFSITSNGGSKDIKVNMTISGANLSITPASLDFGAVTPELQLTLTNTGTSAIDYTVEKSNDWIILQKPSGTVTATDYLNVMLNRGSLSPGDYTGSVTIHAGTEKFVISVRMSVPADDKPSVNIDQPRNITTTGATFSGMITAIGKDRVTSHGFCWGTSPNPTISNSSSNLGDCATPKSFESVATGLESGATYYVRAYATNTVGTAYSEERSFRTQNVDPQISVSPTSLSFVATSPSPQTVNVTVTGTNNWTVSANVTWLSFSAQSGAGSGSFDVTATNNTATTQRTGTITVTSGTETKSISVTQNAGNNNNGIGGTTGPLTWSYDNGVLTIGGTGAMPDYTYHVFTGSTTPWDSYLRNITTVNIQYGVTTIGDWAFVWCESLTSITIPNSVTTIGGSAFVWCSSLTSITIPNSVTTIGGSAFSQCESLTSITIPNSVTTIGERAFSWCSSLTSITIPNSVTTIGSGAFYECRFLHSITIGSSVTTIGDGAFNFCTSLTSITIPNSVTSIGDEAFLYCSSLTSITIPNSVTTIGQQAFSDCSSLASVTIGNSVTTIGNSAFSSCSSLISITIPNSVTTIGSGAFSGCSSLTSITIGNSVTTIGSHAFYYCRSLRNVVVLRTTPPSIPYVYNVYTGTDGDTFLYVPLSSATLTVPSGCKAAYEAVDGWKDFGTIVEATL